MLFRDVRLRPAPMCLQYSCGRSSLAPFSLARRRARGCTAKVESRLFALDGSSELGGRGSMRLSHADEAILDSNSLANFFMPANFSFFPTRAGIDVASIRIACGKVN